MPTRARPMPIAGSADLAAARRSTEASTCSGVICGGSANVSTASSVRTDIFRRGCGQAAWREWRRFRWGRSEEHTSELQSLMRISYAVFCLKKKKNRLKKIRINHSNTNTKAHNHIVNTK